MTSFIQYCGSEIHPYLHVCVDHTFPSPQIIWWGVRGEAERENVPYLSIYFVDRHLGCF